jgi:hypothetical protein
MRWTLAALAVLALVAAAGACGQIITVPDQGIIVTGCQQPAECWRTDCDCKRGTDTDMGARASCTVACQQTNANDPSTCYCMPVDSVQTQCIEESLACIGRGPACFGVGALCQQFGTTCNGSGTPPMLIPTGMMPMLEPHCEFTDDVCCPGQLDGGTTD